MCANFIKKLKHNNQSGFIAMIFVLVMAAILVSTAVVASLNSIQNLQIQLWRSQSFDAHSSALMCLEDGLLKLRKNWENLNYSLLISGNSCTINIETSPTAAMVVSLGQNQNIYRQISVELGRNFKINNWQE